eukprot:scaffold31834_cov71-Phaeocystis_antarctica.AAC.1
MSMGCVRWTGVVPAQCPSLSGGENAGRRSDSESLVGDRNDGSRFCCLTQGGFRRDAGRDAIQIEVFERRQRAPVERSGEGGAAGVGDLGVAEVELLEHRQHTCRRRRRTCRRWRRHEGGEALVSKRVASETEMLQRGPPPQGRREGHQRRVADGGVVHHEDLEPRQGASSQGGSERRGACVAHMFVDELEPDQSRQRARAQPLRQPLHALGAGCRCCGFAEHQPLERWQHRAQRAQQRQVGRGEAFVERVDLLRLAQLLAASQPHLAAQRCGSLMISPQLLQQRLRRRPQLIANAAQGYGDAGLEHVAQLDEEDALLVTAQRRERHRGAARAVGR